MYGWEARGSGSGTAGHGIAAIGIGRGIHTGTEATGDSPALAWPNKRINEHNPWY
jgi:hypothetical protein